MKKALLFLIVFSSYFCSAQNYRCLQPGVKPFYTNGNGYLRGMRIDSVRANGSDTIFYPYHTPRGNYTVWGRYLDSTGGSWLGLYASKDTNGVFFFGNMYDTVVIKTQAAFGDAWIFYNDNSDTSYKATVTAVDTMTILGVIDSVKEITIEADTNGVMNTADPVNNFEIILSKNHGFVQIFDLYTFPYRLNIVLGGYSSFDYYLDLVLGDLVVQTDWGPQGGSNQVTYNNSIFQIVPFHNPTLKEVYNFSIGEVLERNSQESQQTFTSSGASDTIVLETVESKSMTASTVTYTISANYSYWGETNGSGLTYSYFYSENVFVYDTTLLIDTTLMPEEWDNLYFYHFFPKTNYDSVSACPDTVCIVDVNNISYPSGIVEFELSTPMGSGEAFIGNSTAAYGIGFGMSSYSYNDYTNAFTTSPYYAVSSQYVYIDNNGRKCGTYTPPLSVKIVNAVVNKIDVFPNPAHDVLNIDASGVVNQITISNLVGQTVYSQSCNSDKVLVNVAGLPSGVYFVQVNGGDPSAGFRMTGKFVKE